MPGRTGNVRIVINQGAIERLTAPGGMVYEHAVAVRDTTVAIMQATAPMRSGALRASIRRAGALKSGPQRMTARATIGADHARFVIGGTTGPIRPRTTTRWVRNRWGTLSEVPTYLALRNASRTRIIARRKQVSGQRANDFPSRALREAMRRHGH